MHPPPWSFLARGDDGKIKPPRSLIRLFPHRCFSTSRESRSRYRRAKRYFSRRTYLPKRRCEMNKAFYLFQRKIFLSRPLYTAREKTLVLFSPLTAVVVMVTAWDTTRHLEEKRKLGPARTNRRPARDLVNLLVRCIPRNLIFRPLDSSLYHPSAFTPRCQRTVTKLSCISSPEEAGASQKWPNTLRINTGISVVRCHFRHDQQLGDMNDINHLSK